MDNTEQRIQNIKNAVLRGEFDVSVEPGDPNLSPEEKKRITERHFEIRGSTGHRIKSFAAERIADLATLFTQRRTQIFDEGEGLPRGAIITLNHFSPLDSTVVRKYILKNGGGNLNIVARDTNFAMSGLVGFLMRYAGTIPLPEEPRQLVSLFAPEVERVLKKGEYLLIYPEAEMWQNYRKPRPMKIGAYYYAVKFDVPVVPMFCEIVDMGYGEEFRLYVGKAIYPDKTLDRRLRAKAMLEADSAFKVSSYERAYGKPLTYDFDPGDIACSNNDEFYRKEIFESI